MFRRVLLVAGGLALAAGTSVGLGSGLAAAASPVQYSGSITCAVTGSASFSPALVNGGSSASTLKIKSQLKRCTDPADSGVTIKKGSMTVTASLSTNNCGYVMGGNGLPTLNGTINWTAHGGSVAPSTVSLSSPSIDYDVNGNTVTAYLPSASASAGSLSGESGSFSGLVAAKSGYLLNSACGGAKGLKSFTFGKSHGSVTGSVTIQEG